MSGKSAKGPTKKGEKVTIIKCDSCNNAFPLDKVGLTPAKVPKGDWFCRTCASAKKPKTSGIMTILYNIAKMLVDGVSIKDIGDYIRDYYDNYREKFTHNDPDVECKKAAETVTSYDVSPVKLFKGFDERNELMNAEDAWDEYDLKANSDTTKLSIDPPIKIKNGSREIFYAIGKGYCGDCWICGIPVFFYFNNDRITGCGECDHIGGIVASLLSGMLTTSTTDKQIYKYNYGTCHVHCNRFKSDTLSMKFNTVHNEWVLDETGINDMVDAIADSKIHSQEYDPEFINIFQEEGLNIEVMEDNIRYYTELWCDHANKTLRKVDNGEIDMAEQILIIIKYTYNNVKDKFKGGGPETEGPEVFKLDELNGFEIDDNLNDKIVNEMLTELRKDPLFYKLLNNLIKSIEETLIEKYGFTPEMIDEFTYHPTYKRPRNNFYETKHKNTYFPMDNRMDFPRDNVSDIQYMIDVYGGKHKNKSVKQNKKTRQSKKKNKTQTRRKTK